ncbi:unnamed protein product [Psylliodes chrysocephalus]|uniref:Uncharacterized protein n=1 Tax=Psylliodes chrysocephalus TaxID=3402493 RepID=A0A9P0CQD9_9CUCU|nr:unnamed protein product [Psylliodes chrysocephala]
MENKDHNNIITRMDQDVVKRIEEKRIDPKYSSQLNEGNINLFLKQREYGTAILDDILIRLKNKDNLEIMYDDPVATIDVVILLKKNFPLLDQINYWITVGHETGLIIKWWMQANSDMDKLEAAQRDHTHLQPLTMENLISSFLFLLCGLIISSLVFLVELKVGVTRYTIK